MGGSGMTKQPSSPRRRASLRAACTLLSRVKALLRTSKARRWPSRTRKIRAISAKIGTSPWRNPFNQAGLVIAASPTMRCYTMQTASSRRSRALRLSMLRWSLNAPGRHLGRRLWRGGGYGEAAAMARRRLWRGGRYGEVWARDPSAKTRDRMMEYVDEAMDD